jgi:hypothetical protein
MLDMKLGECFGGKKEAEHSKFTASATYGLLHFIAI